MGRRCAVDASLGYGLSGRDLGQLRGHEQIIDSHNLDELHLYDGDGH